MGTQNWKSLLHIQPCCEKGKNWQKAEIKQNLTNVKINECFDPLVWSEKIKTNEKRLK